MKMFTNEFDFDGSTTTTVLDETAKFEDIQLVITDDYVFLRQWNERMQKFDVITMSHKMYYDLIESKNHSEGLFETRYKYDYD